MKLQVLVFENFGQNEECYWTQTFCLRRWVEFGSSNTLFVQWKNLLYSFIFNSCFILYLLDYLFAHLLSSSYFYEEYFFLIFNIHLLCALCNLLIFILIIVNSFEHDYLNFYLLDFENLLVYEIDWTAIDENFCNALKVKYQCHWFYHFMIWMKCLTHLLKIVVYLKVLILEKLLATEYYNFELHLYADLIFMFYLFQIIFL